jgi:PKD repeat protein
MLGILIVACSAPDTTAQIASVDAASEARRKPIAARIAADVADGEFPLEVSFDASGSTLGAKAVEYEWSFGDGTVVSGGPQITHTYIGAGSFDAKLTLKGGLLGKTASATTTVTTTAPGCPDEGPPVYLGSVDDPALDEISGIAVSRIDPEVRWVHEDSGNSPVLVAMDSSGATLSEHPVVGTLTDWEDIEVQTDPATGVSKVFLADIGDNGYSRGEVAVYVADEPDPGADGDLAPLKMRLTYPGGPRNAEALLVDPVTFDLYIVSKVSSGASEVFVKRAPHDSAGPFVLENLGAKSSLTFTATGGDVSADGTRIVLRDYTSTAHLWVRDGYVPLEDAFEDASCPVTIHTEQQGEAIAFGADGTSLLTASEGVAQPLYEIGL